MIEVRDFFTHDEIFEQRRSARTGLEGVLVVGNLDALISRQGLIRRVRAELLKTIELRVGVGL